MSSRGLGLLLASFVALPAMAEERRQLDAHAHGRGNLNIAIEGNRVAMELIAPGADIVGFEHAAKTADGKAAVDEAKAALGEPLALFPLPAAAGCRVTEARVSLGVEKETHEEESHSEFHGEYLLTCAAPGALVGIDFNYFERFSAAKELQVRLITDKGQSMYRVTRGVPRLDLKGIM